ncbi:MAG: oxidative damage protection protein [Thermoanaerobaculia bacterium]
MSATVACARCARPEAPAVEQRVFPGSLGDDIQERVCRDCWAEWQQMEVMVINELRLNFMDPQAQDVLTRQMREFLCLDAGE